MNKITSKFIMIASKIPIGILYGMADVLFFFQKNFIQYRNKVVTKNLNIAFPQKSVTEIKDIKHQFFRHLCDFAVESIMSLDISQKELDKRLTLINIEVLSKIKKENKNLILLSGHIFNWEWLIGVSAYLPSKNTYAVYHPTKNESIDKMTIQTRERFGSLAISMNETARYILKAPEDGESTFLMVSDQKPHSSRIKYDLDFFGHNTPVFQGFDKLARKKNMAVVYIDITKTSRGKYTYEFVEIVPKGEFFEENEIVHKFYSHLEANIKRDPSNWLWSHRRWKYIKGKDY